MADAKSVLVAHYDACSPMYAELYGDHLHFGVWRPGDDRASKSQASVRLIHELLDAAALPHGCAVLDIGCGMGGTAAMLYARHAAVVTGINISARQVDMATRLLSRAAPSATVLLMDAESMSFPPASFDAVFMIESFSQMTAKRRVLRSMAAALKPGGKLVISDWMRAHHVCASMHAAVVHPMESQLGLSLLSFESQEALLREAGMSVILTADRSAACQRTFVVTPADVMRCSFWQLAWAQRAQWRSAAALQRALEVGFDTGTFKVGYMIAQRGEGSVDGGGAL